MHLNTWARPPVTLPRWHTSADVEDWASPSVSSARLRFGPNCLSAPRDLMELIRWTMLLVRVHSGPGVCRFQAAFFRRPDMSQTMLFLTSCVFHGDSTHCSSYLL